MAYIGVRTVRTMDITVQCLEETYSYFMQIINDTGRLIKLWEKKTTSSNVCHIIDIVIKEMILPKL